MHKAAAEGSSWELQLPEVEKLTQQASWATIEPKSSLSVDPFSLFGGFRFLTKVPNTNKGAYLYTEP